MLKLMQSEDRIVRRNACMAMGVMTAHRGCFLIFFIILFLIEPNNMHWVIIHVQTYNVLSLFSTLEYFFFSAEVRKFLRKREESVPAFIQLLAPEG